MHELSQSMEDYLEAIWVISLKKKIVRVKDLMKYFNYKVSSINNAINVLLKKKLIIHEKFEHIELTKIGAVIASQIYDRHKNITAFFSKILLIDEQISEKDACNIEHYIHKETYKNLLCFMKYVKQIDTDGELINNFSIFLQENKNNKSEVANIKKLSNLKKGEKGIIKRIEGDREIKLRLLSMGLIPDEFIMVEKVAPLGDPIDIYIKGYHLSLRKKEAELIIIEAVD